MNYYERIQSSLDYIEAHLTDRLPLKHASARACFSLSHYYRIFHALVGHSVKEYIRKRRLTEAARRLVETEDRIIDIAFDYQFESQESFSRAFKAVYGVAPGRYRRMKLAVDGLKRVDLIKQYFLPDMGGSVSDPRIKVLKELAPMRVAFYRKVSATPERDSIKHLLAWANRTGLLSKANPYRIFGFNNPNPTPGSPVYGYEMWITVGPEVQASGDIEIKEFSGGLYAVTGTTVAQIEEAWRHFVNWQRISNYTEGPHQCLEELLSPAGTSEESMQIDLYLPLKRK